MFWILALVLSLFGANPAAAQGCGPQNPNCIVPTAPAGTSNNQAASTEFVTGAVSTAVTVINVKAPPFNAVCNGVADDSAAIQAAINSLPNGGGIVEIPNAICKINSTINIGNGNATPTASTRQGIILRGVGNPTETTVAGFNPATAPKLLWGGGGSPMIAIQGPINGWGVQDLFLECGSVANSIGIQVLAGVFGDSRDLTISNCNRGIAENSYPNFGNLHNAWRNVTVSVPTISGAFGIFLDGDGVGTTSNTSFDYFSNLNIALPGTLSTFGIYLKAADSNQFFNVHISGGNAAATSIGFDYTAPGVAGVWPSSHMFYGLEPFLLGGGTQFANGGTPGAGATANTIVGLAESNGAVCPNIPNLACISAKRTVFSLGGNTNNTAIIPPTAPGATVNFQIPNVSGTPAISVPSPLSLSATTGSATWAGMSSDGVMVASSATTVVTNRCTMDTNQTVTCQSGVGNQPQFIFRNSANDGSSAFFTMTKSRAGGNTNNGDQLGAFSIQGFSNGGLQQSAQILANQNAASSGSNIPSKLGLYTSNAAGQNNQRLEFDNFGHAKVTASAGPTLTAGCNGAGNSVTGSDTHGTATGQTAAATTCTLTFANAYISTPDCVVIGQTSPLTGAITPGTGTLVVNFASTANYKFTWLCLGL